MVLKALSIEGHVGQIQGQAFGLEHRLNHRQVTLAPIEPGLEEIAKPALKELNVGQHPVVDVDADVRRGVFEIGRNGFRCCRLGLRAAQ